MHVQWAVLCKMLCHMSNEFVQCSYIILCSVSPLLLFSFSFHVLSCLSISWFVTLSPPTYVIISPSPLCILLFFHILCFSSSALLSLPPSLFQCLCLPQDLHLYNSSVLRPRVVGEWVGREEDDSDPLAAEMLQPPVPRAKTESWGSGETSPAGR